MDAETRILSRKPTDLDVQTYRSGDMDLAKDFYQTRSHGFRRDAKTWVLRKYSVEDPQALMSCTKRF